MLLRQTALPVTEVAMADAADVDRAVASARASFEDRRWAGMAPADRKDVMIRWAHLVNDHADQLAVLTALEMGKPVRQAVGEVKLSAAIYQWYADQGPGLLEDVELDAPGAEKSLVRTLPIGPLLGIMPDATRDVDITDLAPLVGKGGEE